MPLSDDMRHCLYPRNNNGSLVRQQVSGEGTNFYCTCLRLCSEHCISLKSACKHCVYLHLICNMYCGNDHEKTINLSVWPGSCSCSHICLMRLNERQPIRIIVCWRRPYYWMCFHIPSCFQVEVEMSFIYSRAALNRQKH